MANLKVGICPSCGKERQLAMFKFGVIQSTMCPYCLYAYLDRCVLPRLDANNNTSDDKPMIMGENINHE